MSRAPFINIEYFFNSIYEFMFTGHAGLTLPAALDPLIFWIKIISLVLTPFCFVGIIILSIKIARLRAGEVVDMVGALSQGAQVPLIKNERWEQVIQALASENPAEWKLAIIEADNMLDEMVKRLGAMGENLGERLKSVNPAEFLTLNDAWEAHKVRNQIAHESNYALTHHAARQAIERYRRVFEEFEYI